jgi:hypothetical protein
MTQHLNAKTLSALVKKPGEHLQMLKHLSKPCRQCESFLVKLGGGHLRLQLVAMLMDRATAES